MINSNFEDKGFEMVSGNAFEAISINVASPEKIRSWSHGEIKNPETIAGYTLPTAIVEYFQHHGPKALSVEEFERNAGPIETEWLTMSGLSCIGGNKSHG